MIYLLAALALVGTFDVWAYRRFWRQDRARSTITSATVEQTRP